MTGVSLGLVLVAAFFHATWNLLAKRAGTGGAEFVWLHGALSTAIYLPVVIVVVAVVRPAIGAARLVFMFGSGVLHVAYFTILQRGYHEGDLSLVYPLARGSGPMLSTAAAIAFLGEHPTPLALTGAGFVCVGVLVIGTTRRTGPVRTAVIFGLSTGGIIAAYTLWDKHAVSSLAVPAVLLDWSSNLVRSVILTPRATRRFDLVRDVWTKHRNEAIGVAILAPLAYILVLIALSRSLVSYIAPAREVSILIGTFFGVCVLREEGIRQRLIGAAAIVAGLVCLALG